MHVSTVRRSCPGVSRAGFGGWCPVIVVLVQNASCRGSANVNAEWVRYAASHCCTLPAGNSQSWLSGRPMNEVGAIVANPTRRGVARLAQESKRAIGSRLAAHHSNSLGNCFSFRFDGTEWRSPQHLVYGRRQSTLIAIDSRAQRPTPPASSR